MSILESQCKNAELKILTDFLKNLQIERFSLFSGINMFTPAYNYTCTELKLNRSFKSKFVGCKGLLVKIRVIDLFVASFHIHSLFTAYIISNFQLVS